MTRQDLVEAIIDKLQEASIDHVTPALMRGVRKIRRALLRKPYAADIFTRETEMQRGLLPFRLPKKDRAAVVRLGGSTIDVHSADIGGMFGPTGMTRFGAAGSGGSKQRRKAQILISPMFTDSRDAESRAQTVQTVGHELLHATDKGLVRRGGSESAFIRAKKRQGIVDSNNKHAEYLSRPEEVHAYSGTLGRLGMHSARRLGYAPSDIRTFLRSHFNRHAPQITKLGGEMPADRAARIQDRLASSPYHVSMAGSLADTAEQYGDAGIARRAKRKFYKELTKGAERAYGETWSPLSTGAQRLHQRINARVKK